MRVRARCLAGNARPRHSASGWFSGRALSNAGKLQAGGIGRDDLWEFVERDFKPAGVCNLRDQADVGERDVWRRKSRGRSRS